MPGPSNFADRLQAAVERTGTPCIVGLDPHLELLPTEFEAARDPGLERGQRAQCLGDFVCEVIRLVAGRVPAVKPQSAFFEALGSDGARAWERVVAEARAAGLLVIGDVKRGDIQSSAAAYSQAFLGTAGLGDARFACDAITINPLLGADSVEPFLAHCRENGSGLFVLVRTSNPSSADFQRHGEPELSHVIAAAVDRWGEELIGSSGLASVGAVVGATHSRELQDFRARMPRTPILLPGYGAQGGGAGDVVDAFMPGRGARGALVSSSRGILFAWREGRRRGFTWQQATLDALDRMIAAVGEALARR